MESGVPCPLCEAFHSFSVVVIGDNCKNFNEFFEQYLIVGHRKGVCTAATEIASNRIKEFDERARIKIFCNNGVAGKIFTEPICSRSFKKSGAKDLNLF
jgi:hypothetical protein